jgi:hypothetical protein
MREQQYGNFKHYFNLFSLLLSEFINRNKARHTVHFELSICPLSIMHGLS